MGGALGRVVDSYNDSDDDQAQLEIELVGANEQQGGNEVIEMPNPELVPSAAVSPLLFGGNLFPNGDPNNPVHEVMFPLLQRLASNTPQLSHTRTVNCPFNVNKASIKLVPRVTTTNASPSTTLYDLQFTFDATEAATVKIFFCVEEKFSNRSFDYFDVSSGEKIASIPFNADSTPRAAIAAASSSSTRAPYLEKRFEAGLGQTFFTLGSEALDITKYAVSDLTWNQLEQQLEAEKARARAEDEEAEKSDASSDEEQESGNTESAPDSDDETEVAEEMVPLTIADEEEGIVPARRSRRRVKKVKKRFAAAPRPKPSDYPLVVKNLFPIVIVVEPILEVGDEALVEAQITHVCLVSQNLPREPVAEAEAASSSSSGDVTFVSRVIRQKLLVNGAVYNVYDIFGVENGNDGPGSLVDGGLQSSCVICMSEPRTTIVIPCRHMCLCEDCAETLKVQSVKCPICRGPVRSLLKVELGTEDADEDEELEAQELAKIKRKRKTTDVHENASDSPEDEPLPIHGISDDESEDDVDDNVHTLLVKGAK